MEVRDAVRAGTTTIVIAHGGVEQNGPYVAGGKQTTSSRPSCRKSRSIGQGADFSDCQVRPRGQH